MDAGILHAEAGQQAIFDGVIVIRLTQSGGGSYTGKITLQEAQAELMKDWRTACQ